MKVAAVQFTSNGDINHNKLVIMGLVREAAGQGARLIVLPEAASQSFSSGRLDGQAQSLEGPFATALRDLARELDVVIVAGMFRPADTVTRGDKTINRVYNTALVTGAGIHAAYDKIHTYDAFDYRESDTVKPGKEPFTFELDGITVGVAICYDIRFPELFKQLASGGASVIVVPFSWADGPGKRQQWRLLSAARALDSTSFLVAAGQSRPGGKAQAGKESGPYGIGHSVVVTPTGRRMEEAGYEDTIIYAELDPDEVDQVRKQLPVLGA